MKSRILRSTLMSAILLFPLLLLAADTPLVSHANSLKKKEFSLRAHEQLFGPIRLAGDDRKIREADVSLNGDTVVVGKFSGWQGKYFVSGEPFTVHDVKYDPAKDSMQVKVWGRKTRRFALEDEIKINFVNASKLTPDDFDKIFFSLFFKPEDSVEAYEKQNDANLVAAYLNQPELAQVSQEDKLKMLQTIRSLGKSAKPELEHLSDGLYVPIMLADDDSTYNDIKVSKNQRLASTIEAQLPKMKAAADKVKDMPGIKGVRFNWDVSHRNFVEEKARTWDTLDFLASLDNIKSLSDGNLSAFELVQKSILRINGTKFTLTSYDPIGAN